MTDDDPRFEVENDAIRNLMRNIAGHIERAIASSTPAKPLGFGLFLFEYGEDGAMFWISNAEREGISQALREFLAREARN